MNEINACKSFTTFSNFWMQFYLPEILYMFLDRFVYTFKFIFEFESAILSEGGNLSDFSSYYLRLSFFKKERHHKVKYFLSSRSSSGLTGLVIY